MDSARVNWFYEQVRNLEIGGWKVLEVLGAGKSALVVKASKNGGIGALKIFDPALVERYGREQQTERINRELRLVEHSHQNIVTIIDGGVCPETKYLYVVMEFIEWPTLDKIYKNIPLSNVWKIISQLATAAKFLEDIGIVHRDIKPSNIMISPNLEKLKLLDLGVIKPLVNTSVTDEEGVTFVGTLRYGPPEFILRTEKNDINGYRAINFYQLGACLYELIFKKTTI